MSGNDIPISAQVECVEREIIRLKAVNKRMASLGKPSEKVRSQLEAMKAAARTLRSLVAA